MQLSETTRARIATHIWFGYGTEDIARNTGYPVDVIRAYRTSRECIARLERIAEYYKAKA